MSKRITIIGTGYVGLVAAIGLADFGNSLIGVDIDEEKIIKLNQGIPTIYEPGIVEYLQRNLKSKQLTFTSDLSRAIREAEVIFIAVGTPPKANWEADLSQIQAVIKSLVANIDTYKVIVTKSTVPVGTNKWIKEQLSKELAPELFDVVSNPEFLREGRAVQDFFHPDRIVVGCESPRAKEVIEDIFRPLYLIQTPFVWCNLQTAELIKYASNAFLATKITFINQMANLAEVVGGDVHLIAKAMGMDGRISSKFLHPGPGYGGSCFPKDTAALVHIGEQNGVDMSLISAVVKANQQQKELVVVQLKNLIGSLEGKTITLLGLAFKSETDDVRDSPALTIAENILKEGGYIQAHDPKALETFRKAIGDSDRVCYFENKFEAVNDADAIVVCTEWNEYRNMDLRMIKKLVHSPYILDTRNVLDAETALKLEFVYKGRGR